MTHTLTDLHADHDLTDYLAHTRPTTTTRIHLTRCRSCDALTALTAVPFPVSVDPTPLSTLGEAIALLTGHTTWQTYPTGRDLELEHRRPGRITDQPADTLTRHDVLPTHTCHQPITTPALRRPTNHRRPTTTRHGDTPPF